MLAQCRVHESIKLSNEITESFDENFQPDDDRHKANPSTTREAAVIVMSYKELTAFL